MSRQGSVDPLLHMGRCIILSEGVVLEHQDAARPVLTQVNDDAELNQPQLSVEQRCNLRFALR
jgi:hypothetical protein